MRRALLLVLLVACKSTPKATPAPEGPSDAATKMPVAIYDASPADDHDSGAAVRYDAGAGEIRDFRRDTYGEEEDAGADDPKRLKATKYELFSNSKYHFTVDVPTSFTAMHDPDANDGGVWRVGKIALIAASASYAMDEVPLACVNSKNVTTFRKGKDFCWSTGKKDGVIYWEKYVRRDGTDYSLRFQYAESLKEAMDPIVKHVSSSWSP